MIIPDVNLLVYAHDASAPQHAAARSWWEGTVQEEPAVGVPWAVTLGFIRVMTGALKRRMTPAAAVAAARAWHSQPNVQVVEPGPRHLDILQELFAEAGVAASLTTDAHLAALAIELDCELCSNDADFGRFARLRWVNPLAPKGRR